MKVGNRSANIILQNSKTPQILGHAIVGKTAKDNEDEINLQVKVEDSLGF